MAEEVDFVSQCYSFLYNVLLKGFIAVIVLSAATLLTKKFGNQDFSKKRFSGDTNFCSSSECFRCSGSTSTEVLSEKLERFLCIKGDITGLERFCKGTECFKTQDRQRDLLFAQKPTVFYVRGLSCRPWHDEYKEQLRTLSSSVSYELIKSEFKRIRSTVSKGWSKNTTPDGEWLVFHLFNQGEKVESNCAVCPNTLQTIEGVQPFIKGCSFGNALFSVIGPGTHITSHYGPTNCRLRCHLPLFVPEGCFLCVNGEERQWREKELLLFDDSFLHEAWHRGIDGERVVLMLDLWHPELTTVEKEALSFMFPSQFKRKI